MSGNSYGPNFDCETDEYTGSSQRHNPGLMAQHNGFELMRFSQEDTISLKVVQQLLIGRRGEMLEPTIHQEYKYFEYFDLDSICVPVEEINSIFYDSDDDPEEETYLQDRMDAIIEQSKNLYTLFRSRSFKRLSQRSQFQKVETLISQTEQETKLRGEDLTAKAEYGYVNIMGENQAIVPIDLSKFDIGGICLGLDSLESLRLRNRAIRRVSDLIDRYAGICLIIDPDLETREKLHLNDKQVIYLPTGQDIELE